MVDFQIAALNAAIAPEVSAAQRNAIREWAEHTKANAELLEAVFDGFIVITGFDPENGEPTWQTIPTPQEERATPEWIEMILRRVGVFRD